MTEHDLGRYKAVMFDLDGTLAPSKSEMDAEMSDLLCSLLDHVFVGVISGGSYDQFQRQFLSSFSCDGAKLDRLFLLPTSGSMMFKYRDGHWEKQYSRDLSEEQKQSIYDAFQAAYSETGYYPPAEPAGKVIEDRTTQMTFSALGQQADLDDKKQWDPDKSKRRAMKTVLDRILGDDLHISIGGTTSIDITQKGVDKAFGLRRFVEQVGVEESDVFFVGDALEEGGNDSAVHKTAATAYAIDGVEDTKAIIRELIHIQ